MNSINIITTHIRKIYDFSIVPEAIHISLDRPTYSPFVSIPIHHIPPHPSPFLLFHIIILLPQYSSSSNPSLQISPSEMNEGSTLERGNSAKFILSPILLIPRVIGRVRATSTTEMGILYIYIYIFVSSRVYNIIVEFSFSTYNSRQGKPASASGDTVTFSLAF